MPAVSSIFLVLSLVLAVVIGPQMRPWSWGPALLALAISSAAALPIIWRKSKYAADFGLIALATMVAGWFAWRGWTSPVAELAQGDLLLLAGACGAFISIRAIQGNERAERILIWGITLLLLANLIVIGKQMVDPSFSPVFGSRFIKWPTGFYTHYNEAANYLIASSLLVGAAALTGRHKPGARLCMGLIALCGLVAVYFTHSRGGILGAAVSSAIFLAAALAIGVRRKKRWLAPVLIAIPVILLVIVGFWLKGWESSQQARVQKTSIDSVLDNTCRLYFLGIAMSCIGDHPMVGGGSRSFSWESFRYSENTEQGDIITHIPEQVHNEILQAATDYGIIGAGLLTCLLGTGVVVAVLQLLFGNLSEESASADAWRVGGLAAFSGMFIQSCFSFVFHLLPGAILLGICLGQMSRAATKRGEASAFPGSKVLLSTAALACALLLIPMGWKGTRVTMILWPSYFSKNKVSLEETKIDALTKAIEIWPLYTFYQDRAMIYQSMVETTTDGPSIASAELAIHDYEAAERLHPYEPSLVVNRANILSHLHRDEQAEAAYDHAIHLQGGMEPAFQIHFALANHFLRKAVRQSDAEKPAAALASLEISARQIEQSIKEMHWEIPDMTAPRAAIHESLGMAREANGDDKGALEAYDFATTLRQGVRVHYRAGMLHAKMGRSEWSARRPAEALAHFIEAKKRIGKATELPADVSPSQRAENLAYLEKTIRFLIDAKISPAK